MGNQFKNPLPRKGQPAPQDDETLVGGAQPAAPGDRSQGSIPPAKKPSGLGGGLFVPPWKPDAQSSKMPAPAALADQQPKKRSLLSGPISFAPGARSLLPRTPKPYVQGQHGRYGPDAGPQQMPPGGPPQGPQQMSPAMPPNGPRPMSPSGFNGPQQMSPAMPPNGSRPMAPGGFSGPQQMSPAMPPNGPLPGGNMPNGPYGPQNLNIGLQPAGFPASATGPGMGMPPGGPGMGNGPQMRSASAQPGGPNANAFNGAAGGLGYNALNAARVDGPMRPMGNMGAVAAPAPLPGAFNRERALGGTGSLADDWRNSRQPQADGPRKDPRGGKRKRKRRVPIWARIVISFLVALIILVGGGGFIYYQVNFSAPVSTIVGQQVARAKNEVNPNANLTNGILTGPRVNILLLGSDTDEKFQGQYIAQTDIVVTIDPTSKTVGMLSIPRDFFINVPGAGMHKLDEAYGLGGVALSRETIEQDFGIPINYYAWVGLDGFIKVIDEVGGVDVDVLHPIVDDNYPDDVGSQNPYAVKRLYLAPGPQHLDGPTALEYVRSRHADLVGDFGRSARQQQVLSALKTKLSNPDIFNKLSAIANDLKGYLKTDMELADVLKLMNFARSLDPNKIAKLTLGPPYSSSGTAPAGGNDAGADIVVPNCAQIVPAIQQMFQLGNSAACNITADSGNKPSTLPLAYTTGNLSTQAYAPSSSADDLSSLFNVAGTSASGSTGDPTDLLGMQGLLDLLLMGTFESTDVF